MNLFAEKRWVLETTLTQEECVRRLKSRTRGIFQGSLPTPEKPLYGSVTSSGFAVQFYPGGRGVPGGPNGGANPYYFRGKFTPGAAGTTIRTTYGVSTAYRLFVAGLVSFFLYMGWRISPFYFHGMPSGLQAFFATGLTFIIYYSFQGVGLMTRFAAVDRDPIIGTVADIIEAQVSEVSGPIS